MLINKFKINLSTLLSGTTGASINIPINMEYQMVDNAELIERVFIDTQVKQAINPILDYEKARYIPINSSSNNINTITYNINMGGATTYGGIGFSDSDVQYELSTFTESFLNMNFYDSDNPLTQKLLFFVTLFSEIKPTDLLPNVPTQISVYGHQIGLPGQPKPANDISLSYILQDPLLNPLGFTEGYYLYDYKNDLLVGQSKYLYMRANFNNAKSGTSTNLMVKNVPNTIDNLVHELYTRFILTRQTNGFFYKIDDTYQGLTGITGSNNVSYTSNMVSINLYKIQSL